MPRIGVPDHAPADVVRAGVNRALQTDRHDLCANTPGCVNYLLLVAAVEGGCAPASGGGHAPVKEQAHSRSGPPPLAAASVAAANTHTTDTTVSEH